MPRKKQGQATRVEGRQSSDAKVKKITKSSGSKAHNESSDKTSNDKFSPRKAKKVSTTSTDASAALNGQISAPKVVEDINIIISSDSRDEVDLDRQKVEVPVPRYGTERDVQTDHAGSFEISSNVQCTMNELGESFKVDDVASKRAGISVITRFNSAKETVTEEVKSDEQCDREFLDGLPCADIEAGNNPGSHLSEKLSLKPTCQQQLCYRISASITDTKQSILSDGTPLNDTRPQEHLSKEQKCKLPSSVYGMPASSIEKVLTGLHFQDSNRTSVVISGYQPSEGSFRSVVAEDGNGCDVGSKGSNFFESNKGNYTKLSDENCGLLKGVLTSLVDRHPKLHIPDSVNSDDSNSLHHMPDLQKDAKFPKITSPQILEQHISKIISQNAAIVETLDPLWSKRYLRQSSQNSDTDSKKFNVSSAKSRRLSNDKVAIDAGPSKLQSALLGNLDHERSSAFLIRKMEEPRERSFSTSSIPSARAVFGHTLSKFQGSTSEEERKGNAIKSLLSLKQGRYLHKNDSLALSENKYHQHPQNPEGSIIKDLLLKKKAETNCSDKQKESASPGQSNNESERLYQGEDSCSKFHDESSYNIQSTARSVKNGSLNVSRFEDRHKIFAPTNGFLGSKLVSTENMAILNPVALSNSIEDLLKKDFEPSKSFESEHVGHILKTQLLSPLTNRKSPPMKKRRLSKSIINSEKQKSSSTSKLTSANSSLDEMEPSPQRCRSQSVHLFGGEVQIHDGAKTKRLKIVTGLSSLSPTVFSENYTKCLEYDKTKEDKNNIQTVVTIAQPVHNSGGTVTHVPVKRSPSLCTSIANTNNASSGESMKNTITVTSASMNSHSFETQFSSHSFAKSVNNIPVIRKTENFLSSLPNESQSSVSSPSPFSNAERDVLPPLESSKDSWFSPTSKFVPYGISQKNSCTVTTADLSEIKDTMDNLTDSKSQINHNFLDFSQGKSDANFPVINRPDTPTILLTPSSPPHSLEKKDFASNLVKQEAHDKQKFLSPARPTSLPLKKKPFTMVGSTLISPDTPRPKKSCVQLYINGQAYTYLGLKCSTRSTYCCIYRPQPMFVSQDTDPKLSMYSNWQVVPAKEELCGMTPGQMLSFYNSRQSLTNSEHISTTAKLGDPLSFTHSSYWKFRSLTREANDYNQSSKPDFQSEDSNTSSEIPDKILPIDCSQNNTRQPYFESELPSANEAPAFVASERGATPVSESNSGLDVEVSISDAEGNNTHDEDDDDDDDRTEVNTDSSQSQPPKRVRIFEGGFKSNEDYTYVRGRGRGKYVCEECGIRCKKPSMLKKHIRTHTDLRPYKCRHCSFAFKTKGNLTKHMKSKAHHKKCTELGIVPVPTTSDDSQVDEEALARQEQLRKKNFDFSDGDDNDDDDDDDPDDDLDDSDAIDDDYESDSSSMATSTNVSISRGPSHDSDATKKAISEMDSSNANQDSLSQCSVEHEAARSLLHLSSLSEGSQWPTNAADFCTMSSAVEMVPVITTEKNETYTTASISSSVLVSNPASSVAIKRSAEQLLLVSDEPIGHRPRSYSADVPFGGGREQLARQQQIARGCYKLLGSAASDETSEFGTRDGSTRRYSISVAREARRPCIVQSPHWSGSGVQKIQSEVLEQPMDLRIPRGGSLIRGKHFVAGFSKSHPQAMSPTEEMASVLNTDMYASESYPAKQLLVLSPQALPEYDSLAGGVNTFAVVGSQEQSLANSTFSQSRHYYSVTESDVEGSSIIRTESEMLEDRQSPDVPEFSACSPVSPTSPEEGFVIHEGSDAVNSPDGASRAPLDFMRPGTSSNMEEGKCICRICNKIFAKAGQLRIHVNIHYFERPFRCDNCGVSFRTKGHLQKHKRSVSHYNKVNMNMTFGTPSVDNPRPFKCADCKIAFRIHGHLAKHLRSKMHIMKLECLGKLPFGMYAEMERSGVSLNEIDTTDCNNSLESLQVMAQKLYQRDPRRMRWHSPNHDPPADIDVAKCQTQQPTMSDALLPVPEQLSVALSPPSAISMPVPSIVSMSSTEKNDDEEVKPEPSEPPIVVLQSNQTMIAGDLQVSPASHYNTEQSRTLSSQHLTSSADAGNDDATLSLHRSDTCHICGRMFKSAKFLQVHLYCDHSAWSPNSSEALSPSTQNQRMTVIAQDLSCELCGKHFPNQNNLQQHLLTHTQLRPFVCDICDAGFTSSALLLSHLGTHHPTEVGTMD